ncbi:MAG: response regulator [Candidatus Thorarchaeota archaeon]
MTSVLIVDDDNFLHTVLGRILNIGGHEVVAHAYDGAEAIEKYTQLSQKPEIILMDHRMPVMNGAEATKKILKINPKAKIIFISADESVRRIALTAGALDFLTKPIRSKYLFAIIEKYSS